MAVGPSVTPTAADTATVTSVTAAATSTLLFAKNPDARGRTVYNDSAATLYLKLGPAATTSSYTVQIPPGGHYELPAPCYVGVVHGIWSTATGAALCTEVSG